jgi:DNA invertase Pin-like site-specific DNA recombinase
MLRSLENGSASIARPPAPAKTVFKQWPNNRIAADQQAASNKLLLHLREEGLSTRLIGKELHISKRSVIKRLKKLEVTGLPDFVKKQKVEKAIEKCLAATEDKTGYMSPAEKEKYVALRREVIRLRIMEDAKGSSIALDLQISETLVSRILINAGLRTKQKQKNVSKETHAKITRMCNSKSRSEVARLLRLERSTVYKHAPANVYAIQNAAKVGTKPTAAITGQKSGVGIPISWAGILPKTNTIASQLRA